jgi:hypothetical protein
MDCVVDEQERKTQTRMMNTNILNMLNYYTTFQEGGEDRFEN